MTSYGQAPMQKKECKKKVKAIIEQSKTESAAYTNPYTSNTIAIDDSENIETLKKENEKLKEQNKILKRYMTKIQGII